MSKRPAKGLLIVVAGVAVSCVAATGVAVNFYTNAVAAGRVRTDYAAAVEHASVQYKIARAKCDAINGPPKALCAAEAKAAEKRAMARANDDYKGTPRSRTEARIAVADADYMVTKAICRARAGTQRQVCEKLAKAAQTKAIADATGNTDTVLPPSSTKAEMRAAEYVLARAK